MSPFGTMTLGELIDAISAAAPSKSVSFDFYRMSPTELRSYRGYYEHLAVGFSEAGQKDAVDFLEQLMGAVGSTFEGYKGGSYRMTRDTPVWVANLGDCRDTGIVGVQITEFEVILQTARCSL